MPNGVQFNENYPVIEQSKIMYERINEIIPSCSQTLAKGPTQHVFGIAPIFLQKGKGAYIWDVDGNKYLDYNMGIGPISLGYSYLAVDNAIKAQLEDGITFSLMHPLELEVAELIKEIIPNAEAVRFSKTGADVVSAAIRLARAYTGKSNILCCGYHGWHDWYISVTSRNNGIPSEIINLTNTFDYNNINSVLEAIDENTAAIILEPVVFDEPENDFLHVLAEICVMKNIILIFDEMWSGFRLALGGAQEYFGIRPDLACYSKAVANGMPLAILTGKKEIMDLLDKDVFFYTTFGGETLSLAAAKATIYEMKTKNVIKHISTIGNLLKEKLSMLLKSLEIDYLSLKGYNYRTMLFIHPSIKEPLILKSIIQQELIKNGILWSGYHTISYSHTIQDVEYTISVYEKILPFINKAVKENNLSSLLLGKPVEPVFRKTENFNIKPKK
ncbi:MAG: aminotransferase class III-fold pyridoxal phosphate-dependent enzyme [bacterium]